MRVVVTGSTGNVGTSVVSALVRDQTIDEVVGIARRAPDAPFPGVRHVQADVATDALAPHLDGADAVVHLAWLIQPSRDRRVTETVNVEGSRRVFEAAAAAGVRTIVYASSIGAYSAGPKDRAVDESWPTAGTPTSFYAVDKAAVERILDRFEAAHPEIRVVRLRPGLIFKREAASEIRRLFAGPFLPNILVQRGLIPIVPRIDRLRVQAVHADDVAEAYRLAVVDDTARGAYNIAADPVLDPDELGRILGARPVRVDARVLRAVADLTWRARLQPTPPGWLDMALRVPIMDTTRARTELGWQPRRAAGDALLELLDGLRHGAGAPTPPLTPGGGGPLRLGEIVAGVGGRN